MNLSVDQFQSNGKQSNGQPCQSPAQKLPLSDDDDDEFYRHGNIGKEHILGLG